MLRKAGPDDCESVYELICAMEGERLPAGDFSAIYGRQIQNPNYCCIVCERDGAVIGVLNLRFEEQLHHAARIAEIMEFAVAPQYRGRGTGREMLAHACRLSVESGCTGIEVACNQRRKGAHRFYLREGMRNSHFKFSMPLPGEGMAGE